MNGLLNERHLNEVTSQRRISQEERRDGWKVNECNISWYGGVQVLEVPSTEAFAITMSNLQTIFVFLLFAQSALGQTSTLDSTVDIYAREHGFDGTILVQENGKEVYQRSFGLAERAFKVPVNDSTKFKIASITKAFTAVLILQLYQEGRIDLSKTIGFYLPSYSGEARDRSTIQNLLNHTSGIENIDAGLTSYTDAAKAGILHYQMPFTTDQLIAKFCSGKLVNDPGKVFDYDNAEYMILGKIIEKITGKRFDDVLKERILQPLNLKNTGMLYQDEVLEDLASTYYTTDGGRTFVNDMPVYIQNWYAAGAMYSTTSDLLTFSNALFGGKLLLPKTLDLMLEPALQDYGDGMWVGVPGFANKRYRSVNRPGGVMGANGSLRHFSGIGFEESLDIVMLSNTNATNLDEFSWMIADKILSKR